MSDNNLCRELCHREQAKLEPLDRSFGSKTMETEKLCPIWSALLAGCFFQEHDQYFSLGCNRKGSSMQLRDWLVSCQAIKFCAINPRCNASVWKKTSKTEIRCSSDIKDDFLYAWMDQDCMCEGMQSTCTPQHIPQGRIRINVLKIIWWYLCASSVLL
jgi:hypothetical protein